MRLIAALLATAGLIAPGVVADTIDWKDAQAVAEAAIRSHPSLARVEAEKRAAEAAAAVAGARPNPMLMAGVENLQVDLSRDAMMTMVVIGASQTFQHPARRQMLRGAARLEVDRVALEAKSLREELRRDALFLWYDIAASDGILQTLREVAAAQDALTAATRARYEAGSAIQADVARAQLQRSEIDHQIITESGKRRAAAARLLAMMALPQTTEIPPLQLPHTTSKQEITDSTDIPDTHPALAAVQTQIGRLEREVRLAGLSSRPDVTVDFLYGLRGEGESMEAGAAAQKDTFTVMAKVELPVRRKALIEPRIRQAIALRDAAQQDVERLRRALLSDMAAARERHDEVNRQIEFHEQVLVPQSRMAFESTRAAYESGKATLEAALATEAALIRLESDYHLFLAQHIKAIVDFEAIRDGARSGAIGGSAPVTASTAGSSQTSAGSMGMR
ncbi:MAG TPA: TolC family protein [Thermoanaerobaculia bacterium]|nr:TolC family protein [Thermoanaerobaculia bacterium]